MDHAIQVECSNNLKSLYLASLLYADDHDDKIIPLARAAEQSTWPIILFPYLYTEGFIAQQYVNLIAQIDSARCPSSSERFGYGHNYSQLGYYFNPNDKLVRRFMQAPEPNNTTMLVDNAPRFVGPYWPLKFEQYWRPFVRHNNLNEDVVVNYIHSDFEANILWLDGSVGAKSILDPYLGYTNSVEFDRWWRFDKKNL